MLARALCLMCGLVVGSTGPTHAQDDSYPVFRAPVPVVSVNREQLIQQSRFGQAIVGQLLERQRKLVAENEALTETLEREERELTELRKTMEPAEFAPLAEAFDEKVKRVRRTQDDKGVALAQALETARFRFFRQTENVIARMMQENDILFVLDENVVWLSQGGNITKAVIERLDAAFDAGEIRVE